MSYVLYVRQRSYQFVDNDLDKLIFILKINRYQNECGCFHGAVFMTVAMIMLASYGYLNWAELSFVTYSLSGLLFVFMCTAVGKLMGVGIARFKLNRLYKTLIEERHLELIE